MIKVRSGIRTPGVIEKKSLAALKLKKTTARIIYSRSLNALPFMIRKSDTSNALKVPNKPKRLR